MVKFTVTLKPDVRTTYILRPDDFPLVSAIRKVAENSGSLQYEFDVLPERCGQFSKAMDSDGRVMGWNAEGL